jgi:cytochrome P450
LDESLRRYIDWSRRQKTNHVDGLLRTITSIETFSDDEIVAHCNVLFMSSLEPTAVTLTWALLILSQLPALRRRLREDHEQKLLEGTINETLRLLTPNALMTRLTTHATTLNSFPIPESCELLLSPFLAHREPERFPRPREFMPERWHGPKPSPFVYFPFGGGAHYCAGRSLATQMMKTALAFLVRRFDLVLAFDQEVDWRIDIVLLPGNDPLMSIRKPEATSMTGGKLIGPARELIDLKS